MSTGTQKTIALVVFVAAFAALALIFRESIGLVVFLGFGLLVLFLLVRFLAGRENASRLSRACRALADAFWGIG